MKNVWQLYFERPNKRAIFFSTLIALALVLILFVNFLTYIEKREGFVFNDPILKLFDPISLSRPIFIVTYFLAVLGVILSIRDPFLFISLIQAYTIMTAFRILSIYLVPLNPPLSVIPFSGHTATIFLFAFGLKKNHQRWLFTIGACVVGVLVLLQHVHYSIDVLAAPVFAFGAIFMQKKLGVM
jgi:hypothetical protein